MKQVTLISFCFFVLVASEAPKITPCQKDGPNVHQCALENIQKFIYATSTGVREWNLPKGDPYEIPSLHIKGSGGSVDVDQKYNNIKIHGISGTKLTNIKIKGLDTPHIHVDIKAITEKVVIESNYEMTGKVLLLPLSGKGKSIYTLRDLKIEIDINIEEVMKKGRRHLKITKLKSKLLPQNLDMSLENLFDGNDQLGNQMNTVLNDNWEVVFEDMRAPYEEIVSSFLTNYINRILSALPYDQLFL